MNNKDQVVTLVHSHSLAKEDLSKYFQNTLSLKINKEIKLSESAYDFYLESITPEQNQELRKKCYLEKIDICIQFLTSREKKILLSDMDATIIENETLDDLVKISGVKANIDETSKLAMEGKIDIKTTLSTRVNYLKGKPGTRVALQIYRKSTDSLFNLAITRGKVNIKSVDLAYMLNDRLGYIKLNRFAENAFTEFKSSLNNLLAAGMTNLVLDLRGNGGGFIHIAERIIDEFLEEDTLIVFTTNNKNETEEYFATAQGDFEKGGLYVLIDENSASASEIVAGALQDNDKGTIIGRRSFGKGLVQEDMDLGDGSFVRLTISRYYTPTGRYIQKTYAKKGNKNYYRESQERISSGELLNKDSIKVVDSLKFITPKGKVVYGGGGIIPDVFVPIDTTSYFSNSYFNSINDFAFKYVDSNRKSLEKWTIDGFIKDFDKSETVLNQYLSTLKNSTAPSFKIKQGLKKYLKTAIANTLFGDVGFYRIIHQDDKMLQKVIEIENSN